MTHAELDSHFDNFRQLILEQEKQNPKSDPEVTGFFIVGLLLLQSALGDLKRIADAMEIVALHATPRA